jgi:gluconate 2-dehydrogenase gamma chain
MPEQDVSRRKFLVQAAVGAGAVAGTGVGLPEAGAQQQSRAANPPVQQRPHGEGHGAFFNHDDAATVAAFAERLMPGEAGKPGTPGKSGAQDAGVLNYIDLALAGAYADLQDFYRRGLAQLDRYCRHIYGETFVRLTAARQDEVLAALEAGKAPEFTWPTAQAFFNTLREHTMEGMFADPVYGGNKDFAGWKLVGFPGAQAMFTTADMQNKQAFTRTPITGLQAQAKGPARRG